MPIEFRCPNCNQLLRVPDESAGKQARCPQCQQVTPVPASSAAAAAADLSAPPPKDLYAPPPHNPFSEAAAAQPKKPAQAESFNPYAAPAASQAYAQAARAGELQHSIIDLGEVLSVTWRIFTEEFGKCALIGLIYFAAMVGLMVVGGIFGALQGAVGPSLAANIAVQFANYATSFLVQTWLGLGMAAWAVRMARDRRGDVEAFFGVGRFYLRGLAAGLLLYVAIAAGAAVTVLLPVGIAYAAGARDEQLLFAMIPGAIILLIVSMVVAYSIFLYLFFIVDRDAGVIDAFGQSVRYMRGNRLTTFALTLIVGILGGIFSVCTCYLGFILYMPFLMLMMAMIYLMATGQPHAGMQPAFGQQPFKQT
jgi:phage FluMu protein Com